MPAIVDPATGLQFFELSHEWGHGAPSLPGYDDVKMFRNVNHAKFGVMTHRIRMVMHSGTHLNAPRHLIQRGDGVGEIAMDKLFGSGVVLSLPKTKWQLVTAADLAAATPAIEPEDIVVISTGWHRKYGDSIEYFGRAPGLSVEAAQWLCAKGAKLVAVDTACVDHPLATSLGLHRNGPQMPRLAKEYEAETGREAATDFPDWNPAHRALLGAGVPTIENVGGDVDELAGKRCTFQTYPWKWHEGDACVVRFVAIVDPAGSYRIESGAAA